MNSWLVHRDPYNGAYYDKLVHNWVVKPAYATTTASRVSSPFRCSLPSTLRHAVRCTACPRRQSRAEKRHVEVAARNRELRDRPHT